MKLTPPPPPAKPVASADGPKASRKRPWSKPTVRIHDGVTDVESGAVTHPTQNDVTNPGSSTYSPVSM